jgi:multiple sugar transport system permease protein
MGLARKPRVLLKHFLLVLVTGVGLIPFLLMLLTSLKRPVDAVTFPPRILFTPTLRNYRELLSQPDFLRAILNSLIITASATAIATLAAVFAAYAFSRFRFAGSRLAARLILYLKIVPPIVLVIPYFLLWRSLRLNDTYPAMILMYVTFSLPLLIWMIRSFFADVPVEIEEAAMIDGCSRLQTLRLVLVPTILPGILASSTLSFIGLWNDFLFALFTTGKSTRTLPIEIYVSMGFYELDWARLTTSAMVAVMPAVLFIALAQKYIVRGLTMGAVKG